MLLLTRTPTYAYLSKVIVCQITSTVRGIPQEVAVGRREGLARVSVANFDNVHVVPTASLGERIGAVAAHREREVERALGHAPGWAELKVV
ncbi:MAG: type II toxin-antitoxin system PemK/MazF family toxin [Deltaproteobacteria bacterium]|nr:type II toxin-antitoxin system PemK/MazF family toxin [Deltaproteobacteria bacterium]